MASSTIKRKYTQRLQIPVNEDTWDRIVREAGAAELSIAEVGRTYLEAGMEAADDAAVYGSKR